MEDYSNIKINPKRSYYHHHPPIKIDQKTFLDRTQWLKEYQLFYIDGTLVPLHQAFKQAYEFSIDELEKKIAEIDKIIKEKSNDDAFIEEKQFGVDDENILSEWYFQKRPTETYFRDNIANRDIKRLIPLSGQSIADSLKRLRETSIANANPRHYWQKLIANAHATGDKISPLTVFKECQL
eukprot:CAMPEP_0168570098 /NCGR_PEP_ID=MMETSP0413-20121227/16536_1 /TAXON_ID=136452 /ORGANISM="Filamoeba nolandi, Strain NC-AS-23-1" /LENGTH=180 /DNA_ID=CAMNT_0008602691 /DNA_START=363 /DNA_END=901 /DNA_ORIENTATION=-